MCHGPPRRGCFNEQRRQSEHRHIAAATSFLEIVNDLEIVGEMLKVVAGGHDA